MARSPKVAALAALMLAAAGPGLHAAARTAPPVEVLRVADEAPHPFPHFWETMFGSGRAVLALRGQYRDDLAALKTATGVRYVRFHAILHDENGVYDEDEHGQPVYNFSYVDQIYDGLLAKGVRPVVEIGFMPQKLAAGPGPHPFWYHPNVAPPKDYARWDGLITALARHLVERYGEGEVAQWYFEVWNEPNIDFWAGEPKQPTYFTLYEHTARALKAASPRLRVGGPSSSSAHWVGDFIAHMHADGVPVDFVSTHGYADDTEQDLFGSNAPVPMEQRLCRAVRKVHDEIAASPEPRLPLLWTEWNVPSYGERNARDTSYMGAALADDIAQCDGLATAMSLWTFSAVFEENGPDTGPFHGQFGLIGPGGIRKPGFSAFALLHRLGDARLNAAGAPGLATRRRDGSLAIALWNLVPADQTGHDRRLAVRLPRLPAGARATVTVIDSHHANSLTAFRAMGSPPYPTQAQIAALNRAAALPPRRPLAMAGTTTAPLTLEPNALALIEIAPAVRR